MPRVRFRSHSVTDSPAADSGTVPGQRGTPESTSAPEAGEYPQAEGGRAPGTGYPPGQAGYGQAGQAGYGQAGERTAAEAYGESPESRRRGVQHRPYHGMAGTLMVLSGLLTFFIGITGLISGIFFNRVATYPFYYSVHSRGVTFLVLGAVAFVMGLALLAHLPWARGAATVVAVVIAVANFMFLPFYPFWSVIVLALNVLIIWELTRERGRREFAR